MYLFQSPFTDAVSFSWRGSIWSADSTHNSLITTGNAGTLPARVQAKLRHALGAYEFGEQSLQPGQSIWINVRDLIQNQVPDARGRTIPASITSGVYEFDQTDDDMIGNLYEGKLIIDTTFGHAAYGCANCCGYYADSLAPDPLGVAVGFTKQDHVYVENACTGIVTERTSFGVNWGTGNASIAGINTSGLVSGIAQGLTNSYTSVNLRTPDVWRCPLGTQTVSNAVRLARLACTASVTRGGTATCNVTGPTGTTVSSWTFSDGTNTVTRSTNRTSLSWSGVMVTSGTVSVNISVSGATMLASAGITVNPRTSWAFTAANPVQLTGTNSITCYNGDSATLVSPPNATSVKGASCPDQAFSYVDSAVSDGGPNNGYLYVVSASNANGSTLTKYEFVVVSDILNISSTFYKHQCGTYSATNSSGFIAGSQLNQNVVDHEQGNIFSHWTEYRDAQNNPNYNIGTILEAKTAPPGTAQTTFENSLNSAGTNAITTIYNAGNIEPCGGNPSQDSSQSCANCGGINYSPYQSCTGTPIPYCH